MKKFSDDIIVQGLKVQNPEILRYIYKNYFSVIASMVMKNSGDTDDAKDIFQEALIVVYRKIKANDLKITGTFKSYLYSVCYYMWARQLEKRDNQPKIAVQYLEEITESDLELIEKSRRYALYQKHFKRLSKECQDILELFFQKKTLKEIGVELKLSSEKYIKKRKYLCKERLIDNIKNDPEFGN